MATGYAALLKPNSKSLTLERYKLMSKTFYLPHITARQIEKQLTTCQNLGLILDKYPETQVPGSSQAKSMWLREILPDKHIDNKLAQSAYSRWLRMAQALGATLFSGTTDWRMVVGLGGETVLETDLTLHHLYGIPSFLVVRSKD